VFCSAGGYISILQQAMPSMTTTHGGILYYVVKVPKEMRWVTVTQGLRPVRLTAICLSLRSPKFTWIFNNTVRSSQRTYRLYYKGHAVNDVWGMLFTVGIIRGT
jgi:hypothetical protein